MINQIKEGLSYIGKLFDLPGRSEAAYVYPAPGLTDIKKRWIFLSELDTSRNAYAGARIH